MTKRVLIIEDDEVLLSSIVQTLDLEGLANHRGSLLGAMPGGQPGQKAFETRLAQALLAADPDKPIVVEAESNKIGERLIPPSLWALMKEAPRIEVTASLDRRARYLARAYDDILSDGPGLKQKLAPLVKFRGHAVVDGWFDQIEKGDRLALTTALMRDHYDPAYAKSRETIGASTRETVALDGLEEADLERGAQAIAEAVIRL